MTAKKTGTISEKNVKAVMALMIMAMAFGILLLFRNYKESVIMAGMFQTFIVLVFTGMGMLLGLLYLVNKE